MKKRAPEEIQDIAEHNFEEKITEITSVETSRNKFPNLSSENI